MSTLHLTKVAFACGDYDVLASRIASRAQGGEVRIVTKRRPKRAGELVGGNLYWIVKHRIVAGNVILGFEDSGDGRTAIVCSAKLEPVTPKPRRAHQGWRYLAQEDAPEAGDDSSGLSALPPRLYGRLAALALV